MSQVLITEQHLIDIADSIRNKLGVQTTYKPREFSAAIDSIQTGGGGFDADGWAAGTYPTGALSLQTTETLKEYAFNGCKGITSINAPALKTINAQCFRNCIGIETVYMPELTTLSGQYTLASLTNMKRASFPKLATTGNYAFMSWGTKNSHVEYLVLPSITTLGSYAFRTAFFDVIDLGSGLNTIPTQGFFGTGQTSYFGTVILRSSTVVNATASNAINDIRSTTKVYVPSSLISSYQSTSPWSSKGCTFYAIENSIYDGYYADGTPI